MTYTTKKVRPNEEGWTEFSNLPGFLAFQHPLYKVKTSIDVEYIDIGFIVYKKGVCSGRIAVYFNPHLQNEEKKLYTIGCIETIDDMNCFTQLLESAKKYIIENGGHSIIGPLNGSTWNSYRFTHQTKATPFLLEPITPNYYIDFFIKYGFKEIATYYSQKSDSIITNKERVANLFQHYEKNGVSFHEFDKSNAEKEFKSIATLCNKAFRHNLLFSPISEEKFVEKMMPVLEIMNPTYTILAKHKNEVVGFIFAYQDLINRDHKSIIVKTLARDIDGEYKGMGTILSSLAMEQAKKDGFVSCIHALMRENNSSRNVSAKFNSSVFRQYSLYELTLK
jgi:hypothetical protein